MADPVPAVPVTPTPIYSKVIWPVVIGIIFTLAVQVLHQVYPTIDLTQTQGLIQTLLSGLTGWAVTEQVK